MRPQNTIIERICQRCGKPFMRQRSRVAHSGGKYCSKACKPNGGSIPMEDRFWAKVVKADGCWLWTGTCTAGYGMLHDAQRNAMVIASRYSWQLHNGPIPDGMDVCHHCDNPPCTRPDYLFLGNAQDNMSDCVNKGRKNPAQGERSGHARLSSDSVRQIRSLALVGLKPSGVKARLALAVDVATIADVIARRTWRHLD